MDVAPTLKENSKQNESIDTALQIIISKFSGSISPAALILAFFDWYFHLLIHPGKNLELIKLFQDNFLYLVSQYIGQLCDDPTGECCVIRLPQDKRFIG